MKTLFTFLNSRKKLKAMILILGIIGCSHSLKSQAASVASALNCDGTNDYVDPNNLPSVTNNFTYEMWARPTTTIATDAQSTSGISGISGQRFIIWPTWRNNNGGIGISVGTNGVYVYEHGSNFINPLLVWNGSISAWTHIAVVITNKQPILYINGVLTATGLQSLHASVYASLGMGGTYSGQVGGIGGGTYGYYQGDVDEFRLWSTVRTAAQIAANRNFELNCAPAGLYAYYKFNQGIAAGANSSVTTLSDFSGNAYTGTLTSFALNGPTSNWISPGGVTNNSGAVTATTSSSLICIGQSATLTASGASTYTWMPGSLTTPTIVVSPSSSTIYTVSGTVPGGCTYSVSKIINVSTCAGVANNIAINEHISAYPNPTNGVLHVTGLKENSSVTVVDVVGNKVISLKQQPENIDIDLSPLAAGIYYLTVQNKNERSVVKIVRN